jgi:hypothetical protein
MKGHAQDLAASSGSTKTTYCGQQILEIQHLLRIKAGSIPLLKTFPGLFLEF